MHKFSRCGLLFVVVMWMMAGIGCLVMFGFQIVRAESVMWTRNYNVELTNSYEAIFDGEVVLYNPGVTFQYRAHMENPDTGSLISNNATIPVGTRVRFVFETHQVEDISWFVTGGSFATPYGDWIPNASAPPIACHQKDFVRTLVDTVGDQGQVDIFTSLTAHPPQKILSGVNAFACDAPASNGAQICTVTSAGTYNPLFTFGGPLSIRSRSMAGTYGYFYPRVKNSRGQCAGTNMPMNTEETGTTFMVQVPVQTIPFTLHVIENIGTPPTTPTLSASGGAACIVGTPHAISMTSTDPEGDAIKYGIDWNADGSIDQFIPASGYVPSGTTGTASRTYATTGSKTVNVIAIDEGGQSSPWATLTFSCADSQTVPLNQNNNQNTNNNPPPPPPPSSPPSVDLSIRVIPSLVRLGNTTTIHWSASGVESCTVTAPNSDAWTGLSSPVAGQVSSPIASEMTYTLSCRESDGTMHSKNATVRVLPKFQEV